MGQLVQSALEAAKRGEKDKAIELLQRSLSAHPNDKEAWLVLAAVVDDPERKRYCLNRVLKLDPVNEIARDELLEMDRAYMGAPAQSAYSAVQSAPVPVVSPSPVSQSVPAKPAKQTTDSPAEKTLVFQYPLILRIGVFIVPAMFTCISLAAATDNIIYGVVGLAITILLVFLILATLPKVEITESGLRAGSVLKQSQARWDQLAAMKSNAMKRRLEITKTNGDVVNVSSQVSGYPTIVEIIRQKRPDLFGIAPQASRSQSMSGTYTTSYSSSYATPAFSGSKTFKRSSLMQFGAMIFLILLLLFGGWMIFSSDGPFAGIGVSLIALFFIVTSMFAIQQVKVEANKLITESFFAQKEYAANQIREISIQTVRSRHGTATNYVHVQPTEGKAFSLSGFSEGSEMIYGTLVNWWETYRNR